MTLPRQKVEWYRAHFHIRLRRRGKRMCYWRPVRGNDLAVHLRWPVDFKPVVDDGRG